MDLNEYQLKAYSTAVFGGELNYPIPAIAEEIGEVNNVLADSLTSNTLAKDVIDSPKFKEKMLDELGDVLWNLAVICHLLGIPLESVYNYTAAFGQHASLTNVVANLARLTGSIGKLCGIFSKYVRKHDGVEPKVADIVSNKEDKLFIAIGNQCQIILENFLCLIDSLDIPLESIMGHNVSKLAKRKANNTLGGAGSVERKE